MYSYLATSAFLLNFVISETGSSYVAQGGQELSNLPPVSLVVEGQACVTTLGSQFWACKKKQYFATFSGWDEGRSNF